MKNIMSLYMHALHKEKESFWDYIDLIDCENQKERRVIWYAIASDELQHFCKLKDTIWANMGDRTEMEKAFFEELHCEYEEMKKCLEKRK